MSGTAEAWQQRCIETVVEEGERFGVLAQELADEGRLDVRVPWIPGWTARDLVGHLGTVHRWATAILTAGHAEPPPPEARQAPPSDGLLDWYGAGLTGLVRVLRETPLDAPAWHMSPAAEQVATSWARRQAHELAVHRMDLEAAAGRPHDPLGDDLAEDGVDELLTVVVPRWAHTEPLVGARATVGVTSRGSGRRWTVRVDRGAVTVRPGGTGPVDADVEGDPVPLLLHLWGRPADGVVVSGDPTAERLLRGR
jgi:uncharacterized protein (TIGR03083 family)